MTAESLGSWQEVLEYLREKPVGTTLWSSKRQSLPERLHPAKLRRMRLSTGEDHGQLCDYRMGDPVTGGCLHVRVFGDHYESHFDRVDPARDLAGHLSRDVRKG